MAFDGTGRSPRDGDAARAKAAEARAEAAEERIDQLECELAGNSALIEDMKARLAKYEPDNLRWR